jgi:hypothetical protein
MDSLMILWDKGIHGERFLYHRVGLEERSKGY